MNPTAIAETAATIAAADPGMGWLMLMEHGPSFAIAGAACLYMSKLLAREQTARDSSNKDLIDTLKAERGAIASLVTAVQDLTVQVHALRTGHDSLTRGHTDHGSMLADHGRRIDTLERAGKAA